MEQWFLGNPRDAEEDKYERMWDHEAYGDHSPGEQLVDLFLEMSGAKPPARIIDIGSGPGRASIKLANLDFHVRMIDFTDKGLDKTARQHIPFNRGCLWEEWPFKNPPFDYGFCCDVMEHIPPEYTMLTIHQIRKHCRSAFFHISLINDAFGDAIGETLHLSICPFEWWRDRLNTMGELIECRDFLKTGIFYVQF